MSNSGNDNFQFARIALQSVKDKNCFRQLREITCPDPTKSKIINVAGKRLINFSSNNYLGLAAHPEVLSAAKTSIDLCGIGTGGSRLVSGSGKIHRELEASLAKFKSTESALLFSSGYLANAGLIALFSENNIPIIFDRLSHTSIVDSTLHYSKKWKSFLHNDISHLNMILSKTESKPGLPRALVITEGVFSMDGDSAPLVDIYNICQKYNALLAVDDAHGTGTAGVSGRGSIESANLSGQPGIIIIGTLSKALGSQGGFIAGDEMLIQLMINKCKQFIYDTSPAFPVIAAALKSLEIINTKTKHINTLRSNSQQLRKLINKTNDQSPIIPLIVGDSEKAINLSNYLYNNGIYATAIRPPTVSAGSSRIRFTVTAEHTIEEIQKLAKLIKSYSCF